MAGADKTLDVQGLNGPLPVLKAKKALKEVRRGGTLEVFATDPGAAKDFEILCKATGVTLVEQSEVDGVFRFVLKNTE